MPEPVVDTLGPYTRRTLLGQGPHAEVWLADGPRGPVALKRATTDHGARMLRHEGEVLAGLSHPYVAHLDDRDPDGRWLATDYVEGGPVDAWAEGKTHQQRADMLARIAEGLARLHARGVIHGDLKPSNVLVDPDDRPRIIDLGLAHDGGPGEEGFAGTLGYAAPELLRGEAPTPSSDIYALGAIAYRICTGRGPFGDVDPAALAVLPLQDLPCPPSAWVPDLPQQLGELILRMLARSVATRPRDAALVATALRACGQGIPGPVVVGMHRERAILRRMVVQASNGVGTMVVVHGPPGSGRSTLIRETTEAARREDLQLVRHQPTATGPQVVDAIVAEAERRPSVIVLDTESPDGTRIATRLMARRPPGLVMVRAERPVPALLTLGARHITPPPLTVDEVALMLGGDDIDRIREIHALSGGRPGAIRIIVGRTDLPSDLSPRERRILQATSQGPVPVAQLAADLDLGEHDLLDLAEPLFDRGLLAESEDGVFLERVG
ncbi:MAG: serine/threonine-protein kinase PknK [Deltaproteobacteria bacterium]|nr:MAG: serine/threonine-protein kinase PknK [Deltaproteobacteria bacterium]